MTQEQQIKNRLIGKIRTIKQLFDETKILEPNIRRILGQGVKKGKFVRVARGVYTIGKVTVINEDSVELLPALADKGFKADFIFLDIPYYTPAVRGGNRGIRYRGIYPYQFQIVADALYKIARTKYTPIVYLFSRAPSGVDESHVRSAWGGKAATATSQGNPISPLRRMAVILFFSMIGPTECAFNMTSTPLSTRTFRMCWSKILRSGSRA